jgi:hypothetical protein
MNVRRIIAIAAGAGLVVAALLIIPTKAAASGPATEPLPRVPAGDFLAGYDTGLYRLAADGSTAEALWTDGEVKKILRAPTGWYILTSKGILFSADLSAFQDRSEGLPIKTYKIVTNGAKQFSREVQDLKDLEVDPDRPERLVTCTKDEVFISEDGGLSWKNLGQPIATTGLKAVSFGPYPGSGQAAIWASHPIKGLFVRKLDGTGGWAPANGGLALIQGTTSVEEVADLAFGGQGKPLFASNSFIPRVWRFDTASKDFKQVYASGEDFGTVESLGLLTDGSLRFVTQGGVKRLDASSGQVKPDAGAQVALDVARKPHPEWQLLSVSYPDPDSAAASKGAATESAAAGQANLSELWLINFVDRKPERAKAENKEALYLATGFMVHPETREKYFSLMEGRKLNAVVVDMKDDFGRLRFTPQTPLLQKMGKTSSPMDIETFVKEAKAKNVYLIARVVVFKDQVLYEYGGGRYAVWDKDNKAPWQGYKIVKKAAVPPTLAPAPSRTIPAVKESGEEAAPAGAAAPSGAPAPAGAQAAAPATEREPIKEYWVDPYSEDVWAYNVAIANEIIARGFDEVQFDYIRFPTDGANIDKASFRSKDPGMDKESALASFLRYARENIKAPISIDIYGANGWYRSGVRTGQDVELLAKFVDVICPMYYPSHFEQGFLAQAPAEDRPYRIYRTGGLRTEVIARKRVVVRPYVQAFYMNVSYDRAYYNLDYVKREVAGVRDAVNLGMTFWNNAGRYDDVPILEFGVDGRLSGPGQPATTAATAKQPAAAGSAAAAPKPPEEGPAQAPTGAEGLLD